MHLPLEHLLHCSMSDGAGLQAGLATKDGGLGVCHLPSIVHPGSFKVVDKAKKVSGNLCIFKP